MAISSPCGRAGCNSLHSTKQTFKSQTVLSRNNLDNTIDAPRTKKTTSSLWPLTARIAPSKDKPPVPTLNEAQKAGILQITRAINTTKNRLQHIDAYLPTLKDAKKQQTYEAAQQRLRLRVDELQKLKQAFEHNNDLIFKDFTGWKTGKPNAKQVSQYEAFSYSKKGTESTSTQITGSSLQSTTTQALSHAKSNLSSRIKSTSGQETLFLIGEEDHGNHIHPRLTFQTSQHPNLRVATKPGLNENDEGCPCCAATGTLDLDELATAIPELTNSRATHGNIQIADFNSPAHWGIFLGIAAPLSMFGLTAAVRNIKGSWQNHQNIQTIIKALNHDITANKGNDEAVQKLTAFRNTLRYSRMDAKFNFLVPGVINGVASSLVMSTAAAAHPFALPAIALYAVAQTGRNAVDLARSWRPLLSTDKQANEIAQTGAKKINQVTLSKCRFYAANTTGFAAFTAGATLTALSVLGLVPSLGASAIFLPIGLGLLTSGAITTGVMNNKWPRKFKPRNGELSMPRALITTHNAIGEVGRLKQHKSTLKEFKNTWINTAAFRSKKAGYSLVASLPFLNQFATNRQQQLNRKKIAQLHLTQAAELEKMRNKTLLALSGIEIEPCIDLDSLRIQQTSFTDIWHALAKLGIHQSVFSSWINDGFYQAEMTEPVLTPDNSVQGDEGNIADPIDAPFFCLPTGSAPPPSILQHVHGPDCHHPPQNGVFAAGFAALLQPPTDDSSGQSPVTTISTDSDTESDRNSHSAQSEIASTLTSITGIHETRGAYSLDKNEFIAWMDDPNNTTARDSFYQALDYFLMFTWRKQLRYQQYGLIDYYWQLKKQIA
jgi:hypothetical protein